MSRNNFMYLKQYFIFLYLHAIKQIVHMYIFEFKIQNLDTFIAQRWQIYIYFLYIHIIDILRYLFKKSV